MTRSAPAIFCIALLAIMAQGAFAEQPADVAGVWLSPKANMRVRVGPCGSALCGYIIWMQHPDDPQTGEPLTDRNNPDPAKRNKPILGLQMITDLKPGQPAGEWTGQLYLPNEGNLQRRLIDGWAKRPQDRSLQAGRPALSHPDLDAGELRTGLETSPLGRLRKRFPFISVDCENRHERETP